MSRPPVTYQPTNAQPQGGRFTTMGMPSNNASYQMGNPVGGQQYPMGMMPVMSGQQYYQTGAQGPNNPVLQVPQSISGIPPGLEYLSFLDAVFVKHNETFEFMAGMGSGCNKLYDIFNVQGELIFRAVQQYQPSCTCSGSEFNFLVYNLSGMQVMTLYRPSSCCSKEVLTVFCPPGNIIGTLDPQCCCPSEYVVKDASAQAVLKVEGLGGKCCTDCADVNCKVRNMDGSHVGSITKKNAGCFQGCCCSGTSTIIDNYAIAFPKDLNVSAKATLIGACVLMAFLESEERNLASSSVINS